MLELLQNYSLVVCTRGRAVAIIRNSFFGLECEFVTCNRPPPLMYNCENPCHVGMVWLLYVVSNPIHHTLQISSNKFAYGNHVDLSVSLTERPSSESEHKNYLFVARI